MSLSTVAATIKPDESLRNLPPSHPERFQRSDFIAAALVFFITLGVYIATLAPTVTLEDSGELITAAAKFGVGHPPGYPFWTLSGFILSNVVAFGSLAWRINLLCAVFGGLTNAVLTLLACHSGRWLLQRWTSPELQAVVRPYVFYTGMFAGLVIGFSDVMWSQAVISAVHGTLNALFVVLVLFFFYLWMIEPRKTHRLILAVFIFSLGLTNHHTLVQAIPAFLLAAFLLEWAPGGVKPGQAGGTLFFSLLIAVALFSLSLLVDISWLSNDNELQTISQAMAWLVFGMTAVVSFFYLKEFRREHFLLGAVTAASVFAIGYFLMSATAHDTERYAFSFQHFWSTGSYVKAGWLQGLVANAHAGMPAERQVQPAYVVGMLAMAAVALGLLYSSQLNRRMVIGVFIVGWVGLMPYFYEPVASSTHPPMNWGYPSERSGFYYSVSRQQYPKSLPNLIKSTFGKALGVIPKEAQLDQTIGLPNYLPRLYKTFYYYGDNLQVNFTVPLVFLTLAIMFFIRRCDWPQINWFIFLGAAFFLLGFMLHIIAPPEAFDYERILQYKVFHVQSHCIFVLVMSYGALALIVYVHDLMPEVPAKTGSIGFGMPALFVSLLPLWSNIDGCSQANHWFGYLYGADIMRPMEKNAVYFGGSDPGRFIPTFMAFVESQQPDKWKADWTVYPEETKKVGHGFDRRDITIITQNALCDSYYAAYIRDQYDPRFQPKTWTPFEKWLGRDTAYPKVPVTCVSEEELYACWDEYRTWPEVAARIKQYGPSAVTRPGSGDVFELNGLVAHKIFDKNKKDHVFYVEQSIPIVWMYPYLLPSGLILKMNPESMKEIPAAAIAEDYKFWDDYSHKLLSDPLYVADGHATLSFAKLAYWHADLYRWRKMDKEQEHWLKLSIALCPQLQASINALANLLQDQKRYDEAVALVKQAKLDDPRSEAYDVMLTYLEQAKVFGVQEKELHDKLAKNPYDVDLNLHLARLYQDEGKYPELNDRLRTVAGLTNWSVESLAPVVRYYVETAHNTDAGIAFLEARAKIDPKNGQLIYHLAALYGSVDRKEDALKFLAQAIEIGGADAVTAAKIDPHFKSIHEDPEFVAILEKGKTNVPSAVAPTTNGAAESQVKKPAKEKEKPKK